MELCRLINSCSYLSFTSSLYLCLFVIPWYSYRRVGIGKPHIIYVKYVSVKKASAIQKLHHIKSMCSSYDFFLYLMPSSNIEYVDISNYIILYFKISISECCTDYCCFCICSEERNYIFLSCFMAYDNITLNRKCKKRNEITIYRKDPTLCPIILIPSVCTINEIILRQKIDKFIIFSLTEQKNIGRDCTN